VNEIQVSLPSLCSYEEVVYSFSLILILFSCSLVLLFSCAWVNGIHPESLRSYEVAVLPSSELVVPLSVDSPTFLCEVVGDVSSFSSELDILSATECDRA
jgi:hypothetical protein